MTTEFLITWKNGKKSIIEGKNAELYREKKGWKNLYWSEYSQEYEEPMDLQALPPKEEK
jgi:hypothetical protein